MVRVTSPETPSVVKKTKAIMERVLLARFLSRFVLGTMCVVMLALCSIALTRVSGAAAVLWLPNALIIAIGVSTNSKIRLELILVILAGVTLANLIFGDTLRTATGFGIVNGIEVVAGIAIYERFLGVDVPHAGEKNYLKFLAAIFLTVLLSSFAGSLQLYAAFDVPLTTGYLQWFSGSYVSLCAFLPAFIWMVGRMEVKHTFRSREFIWAIGLTLLVSVVVNYSVIVHDEIRGLFVVVFLFSISALKMGVLGTVFATFAFALILAASSFTEQQQVLSPNALGLEAQTVAFGVVFFCVVLSANLIAAMVEKLRMAETKQRSLSQMRSEFISTMSHEILTPVNVVSGALQVIQRRGLDEKTDRLVNVAQSAVASLMHQASEFLTMSALQDNRIQIELADVPVRQSLDNWQDAVRLQIETAQKPLDVQVIGPVTPAKVRVDRERLTQILLNLSSNAVKFSANGCIRLSATSDGEAIVFAIEDEGKGVSAEEARHVFDRFWQADQGQTRIFGGSGIGLAVCMQLAQLMNGHIRVVQKDGEGARFELILPKTG